MGSRKVADVLATPAIWPSLIAAIQSADGNTNIRQRQLTLARLAWTCRSAYKALRPHLWSTLHLVFRDRGDGPVSSPPPNVSASTHTLLDRHARVMDASLFPHFNPSTTITTTAGSHDARERIKIQRIRAVSEFRYLYPFVVLGGKLYLAALENEKDNPQKRKGLPPVPVPALFWEEQQNGSESNGDCHNGSRIVGGLHLIEYPLHLVTHIIIDFSDPSIARRFECDQLNCKTDLASELPFLLSPTLVDRVTAFDLLAVNPRHCFGTLHHKLSHAYKGVQSHDWAVRRGCLRPTPTVGASARQVCLLNDHSFNGAHPLRAVGMPMSPITHFELHGAGVFHFCWARSQAFKSSSLTTLVLDFNVDFANGSTPIGPGHVAYHFCMPALRRLAMTTSVANLLFPIDSPHYRSGDAIAAECAFPLLTNLTLIPNLTRYKALNQAPALPYTQMPSLNHFTVSLPKTFESINSRRNEKQSHGQFTLPVADLCMLLTHAHHLSSLDLIGVAQLASSHAPHSDPTPVLLTKASLRASHLHTLSAAFSLPNLASLLVTADTQGWDRDLFEVVPNTLTCLTLQLGDAPIPFGQDVWISIANQFPKLTNLDIGARDHQIALLPPCSRDSAFELADARQALVVIEGMSVAAIATEEQEAAAHLISLPQLTYLAFTHPFVGLPPIHLPALTALETHIDCLNLMASHLPHLTRLVLHGKLSAVSAQYIFNLVPPSANVQFVPLGQARIHASVLAPNPCDHGGPLVFKFRGAQHVRTWCRVLHAYTSSAPETAGPRLDRTKEAVKVVLAADVEKGHAELIWTVVQSLMDGDLDRVDIVWDEESMPGKADEERVRLRREAFAGNRCDRPRVGLDCEE